MLKSKDVKLLIFTLSLTVSFILSAALFLLLISRFPPQPKLPDINKFIPCLRIFFNPSSHKKTAYFAGVVFIPLVASILYIFLKKFLSRVAEKLSPRYFIPAAVLMNILIVSIFFYLLYESILSFRTLAVWNVSLDPILFNRYFLLTGGILLITCTSFLMLPAKTLLEKIVHLINGLSGRIPTVHTLSGKIVRSVGYLLIVLLILVTVRDRNMREEYVFSNWAYYHMGSFVRPVFEILRGKVTLVNSTSVYGIFVNYLPAAVFSFIPLSYTNFFYLMVSYSLVYYCLIFVILNIRLKDYVWSVIGLIMVLSLHFYCILDSYTHPQVFPIRYILEAPVLLILLIHSQTKTEKLKFLLWFLTAFSFFYNFEIGISIVIGYLAYVLLETIRSRGLDIIAIMKKTFTATLGITISGLLIMFVYSLYAKLQSGVYPDWLNMFFSIFVFNNDGLAASDGPIISFYLFPVTVYLLMATTMIIRILTREFDQIRAWDGALTVYGILIFNYYIHKSYIPNLPVIYLPALILVIIHLKEIIMYVIRYKIHSTGNAPLYSLGGPVFISVALAIFSIIYFPYRLINNKNYPFWDGLYNSKYYYDENITDAQLIKKYTPDSKDAFILSYFDAYLPLVSDRTNSMLYNSNMSVVTVKQLEEIKNNLMIMQPKYIFVENNSPSPLKNCYGNVFQYINDNYHTVESTYLMNVMKKNGAAD